MKKQGYYIMISVAILATVMNIVDYFIKPQYFVKSAVKVVLFLLVPLIYFWLNKKERPQLKQLFTLRKKALALPLVLGILAYTVLVAGYFLLKNVIDFSQITKSLTADAGVNANNFIYVSIYISLVNSFLEEFFFRVFAFSTFKKHTHRITSYLFSAFIFAFYHIGMTITWVAPPVFICGFIGLFIGGIIFNFMNEQTESIYASWILHIFINLGINTIGFVLFGLL